MLVEKNDYLTAGVHIGMKSCTRYMRQFVYKIRDDGLAVFNLKRVDERISTAARFLAGYNNILAVSRKENGAMAVRSFAEAIGARSVPRRFSPGTLTNPSFMGFFEPEVVIVVDPLADEQAVREAKKKRIPVVSLVDTFNTVRDIDIAIPANNNGKKSLSIIFWILAREVLKARGKIKKDSDFKMEIEDFGEALRQPEEATEEQKSEEKPKTLKEEVLQSLKEEAKASD